MNSTMRARSGYPIDGLKNIGNTAICRFAAGRRRINQRRKDAALLRRVRVAQMLRTADLSELQRGFPARVARTLGVHRETIVRDILAIRHAALFEPKEQTPAQARAERWRQILKRKDIPL